MVKHAASLKTLAKVWATPPVYIGSLFNHIPKVSATLALTQLL